MVLRGKIEPRTAWLFLTFDHMPGATILTFVHTQVTSLRLCVSTHTNTHIHKYTLLNTQNHHFIHLVCGCMLSINVVCITCIYLHVHLYTRGQKPTCWDLYIYTHICNITPMCILYRCVYIHICIPCTFTYIHSQLFVFCPA